MKSTQKRASARSEIRVLQSVPPPTDAVNPYIELLVRSLPESIEVTYFTWRQALTSDFDVFHLHWPEVKIRGRTAWRSVTKTILFLLILVRIKVTRTALVRTIHDVAPHETASVLQRWVIALSERWTTMWISLSPAITPPRGVPSVVIPHGHYRDWFDPIARRPSKPGRIVHFGQLRPYKGTSQLVAAFTSLPDPGLSLRILGPAPDADLKRSLVELCAHDPRVDIRAEYVPDAELAHEIMEAELVVLPFVRIWNSGSLLLALSLDRPVLTSSAATAQELADEVGVGWIQIYDGQFDAEILASAVESTQQHPPKGRPDLSLRTWSRIGEAHAAAYARARAVAARSEHEGEGSPPS